MGKIHRLRYMCCICILFFAQSNFAQRTENCFLKDFSPRSAVLPKHIEIGQPVGAPAAVITINPADTISKISKYLFGTSVTLYNSQLITEPALMKHLKRLSPNILRFPGGSLADVFFWNSPKDHPPLDIPDSLVDSNGAKENPGWSWNGGNSDGWTLSTTNYYKLRDSLKCEGLITINYAYARYGLGTKPAEQAAHYAADWVRYDKGRTKFWEIGNENGGPWEAGWRIDPKTNKDGQPEIITGALYGQHFKLFVDSMRKAAAEIGSSIYIGAQILHYDGSTSWNSVDHAWNSGFFNSAKDTADFFVCHNYFGPLSGAVTPASILTGSQAVSGMMSVINSETSKNAVQMKPVSITEWNMSASGGKKHISYISGMQSVLVFREMIKNQYGMSCRWNIANGYDKGDDHGMFSYGDEPGVPAIPKWNPRPDYFYFYYFKNFCGDYLVNSNVSGTAANDILSFSTIFGTGEIGIVVANQGTSERIVSINTSGAVQNKRIYFYSLTGGSDNAGYSLVVSVNNVGHSNITGGPINKIDSIRAWSIPFDSTIKISSPAKSVQFLLIGEDSSPDYKLYSEKHQINSQLEVYPNPGNGDFNIKCQESIKRIEIYSVDGRLVYSQKIENRQQFTTLKSGLSAGLYILRAWVENTYYSVQLIIQ